MSRPTLALSIAAIACLSSPLARADIEIEFSPELEKLLGKEAIQKFVVRVK